MRSRPAGRMTLFLTNENDDARGPREQMKMYIADHYCIAYTDGEEDRRPKREIESARSHIYLPYTSNRGTSPQNPRIPYLFTLWAPGRHHLPSGRPENA